MVFGPDGNLYVAGGTSRNIVRFNSRTGTFKDVFVSGIPTSGLAFGPDGSLFVAETSAYKISHYDPKTGMLLGDFASVIAPTGVMFDVPPPITNDLFVASLGNGVVRLDGSTGAVVYTAPVGTFSIDLARGPDGALYLSTLDAGVTRLDLPSGVSSGVFTSGGGLTRSVGIAFGPDGNLYVGDRDTSSVLRYNGATGRFVDTFVQPGSGGLVFAEALLFGPDGNLYVTEFNGNRVLRYDGTTGAFLDVFATDPTLTGARSMLFGPDGNLYVAGNSSNNVVRFDGSNGAFIDDFVVGITGANGLAFGPDGNLYVAGENLNKISRYDGTSGAYLGDLASVSQPIGMMFDRCVPAGGGGIDHSSGFLCAGDLVRNGAARLSPPTAPTVLRVTDGGGGEAGSVFSAGRLNIQSFQTSFTLRIHDPASADGMCFVIQGNDPHQLGVAGLSLGYGAASHGGSGGIHNSLCVKFDIFNNEGEGPDSTGLFGDGRLPTVPEADSGDILVDLQSTGIDLHSQHTFQADLTYDGTTLTETITDLTTSVSFTASYGSPDSPLDIPSRVGGSAAFVGFTGGTGGLTATQDVLTWTFRNP
jgi:sugar lactone lactonase YvrE